MLRADAEKLAEELAAEDRKPQARGDVLSDSEVLVDYLEHLLADRMDDIKQLQDEARQLWRRIGELEAENRMLREATPPPA